jgi:ATP-dependent Lon protease
LPLTAAEKDQTYPVLAIQTGVLFPGNVLAIRVHRPDSLKLVRECLKTGRELVATYSPADPSGNEPSQLHQVGVFAAIQDCREAGGEACMVTIEGRRRAAIDKIVSSEPWLTATVSEVQAPRQVGRTVRKQVESVISIVGEVANIDPTYSLELLNVLKMYRENPSMLADHVAATFHFPLPAKQSMLEAAGLRARLERVLGGLNDELNRLTALPVIDRNAPTPTRSSAWESDADEDDGAEAGRAGYSDEPTRIKRLIRTARHLPPEVVARATIEADRLGQLSSASAEYGSTRIYLDRLLNLPWAKAQPENYEIPQARKIISSEYFGPDRVKDRVMQRLAVRKLQGGQYDGPTLCLVGAPGTGKASLAKAIAKSLGKEFIRISVGGITDVADLRGEPRSSIGAGPGVIIRALKDAGTCDPVVLIEDLDYFNIDNDAAVNAGLLEVIDTRYNSAFFDEYLGVPFDLSRVFFICSVRSPEEIPEQFVPRLELLELPGYIEKEKIQIAKKYIIPEMLRRHGIMRNELRMTDHALSRVIGAYTQESGLLMLAQQIEKICRKVALEKVETDKKTWHITESNVGSYLGPNLFIPEKAEKDPEIGIAAGLAWTGMGGELMFIEGLKMKGEGDIITTGSLGEVMKESIQAAHSYVRSKSDMLGIDFSDYKDFDIHIHFPSGAIPKDGPSAGVTVCLVIASVLSERPIRNDIAMTGELTLRGKVLPVGGIKEKVAAAYRSGIFHVALPKECKKDLKDLPREIERKCEFTFIERVDELFELCLMDFTPSAYTLEKVFQQEVEKVKQRSQKSRKKPDSKSKDNPKAARKRKDD